jgi:hypothetical protein
MHCDNILETQLRMKRDDDQARALSLSNTSAFSLLLRRHCDLLKKTILQPSHVRYLLLN